MAHVQRLPEPPLIRFGPEHGLSKNINDLAIDRLGYLWLATMDGLARYDGHRFRHWRHEPPQPDSLSSNIVFVLRVDRQNRLWVATDAGLSVLGSDRRGFRHIDFQGQTKKCAAGISALGEGADGSIWLGTSDGVICRIDPAGNLAKLTLKDAAGRVVSPFITTSLHSPPSGDLWIGSNLGLMRLRDGIVERPAEAAIGSESVYGLSAEPGGGGGLLVGAKYGFYRVDPVGQIENLSSLLPEDAGSAIIVPDGAYALWIGTSEGLFRREWSPQDAGSTSHDWRNGRTIGFASRTGQSLAAESLFPSGIFAMAADLEGGLWVVGQYEGLAYLPPTWRRFVTVDRIDGERAERLGLIGMTTGPNGEGWLLAWNHLYRFSLQGTVPQRVVALSDLGIADPRVIGLCAGRLLIGNTDGIVAFDPLRQRTERLKIETSEDAFFAPERIACAKSGEIIVAQYGGGIDVYSADGRRLHKLNPRQTFAHAFNGTPEIAIAPDGVHWYNNDRALFRWNGRDYTRYDLLPGPAVSAFAFADANEVWVARFGALERYRWDGRRLRILKRIGPAQGMPDAVIEGLLPNANGNLWLTTGRGLALYDRRQSRIRVFSSEDGLPGIDFYYGPPKMLDANHAVALSMDGMVIFDPQMSLPSPKASRLTIEALSLRRDRGEIALDPARPVLMRAGDRDLRILPRLLSFVDKASQRYRSRLHGEDADWVVQQGNGERVFSSLPPGRYTLELQGANADGIWSPSVSVQIEVLPPWWRSAWAILAYALLASALLWWLAYLDQLKLKRRHSYQLARQKREWAEQASEAKSRFLADLGHELRTPMTGVLGMSELLLSGELAPRQHGQVQSIRRAGEHLLRLVDDALDLAKIEAGRLELEAVPFALTTLVDEVAALVSPLAARKGLRFVATRTPEVPETWVGDPLRLRQILLNLLGNAVKFTERGEVGLRIEGSTEPHGDAPTHSAHAHASEQEAADPMAVRGRGELRLIVHDTGPGMDAEQLRRVFGRFEQAEGARTAARYGGTGLGLAISRELALAMGGEIAASSRPGEGTEFALRLSLPFAPASAAEEAAGMAEPPAPRALAAADWKVILLVEDDPTVAEVLSGLLQQQGHRVVHAAHGLAAMTEALLGRFDLALIDLDLPGLDGCALAGQLRASGFAAPMLAITARADAQAEPDALAAGFAAFLRKPIAGERLRAAILAAVRAAE